MTRSALGTTPRRRPLARPCWPTRASLASGSLRLLDEEQAGKRELSFFAYAMHLPPGENERERGALGDSGFDDGGDGVRVSSGGGASRALRSQEETLRWLAAVGFATAPGWSAHESFEAAADAAEALIAARDECDFDTDGAVLKMDSAETQRLMGSTSSDPRWAVALKPPARQATSVLENLSVAVGRTGHVVPVARVRPVEIGGALISRTTLHNVGHALRMGVREGDTVVIERAGDVIPRVLGPVEGLRGEQADGFVAPSKCPGCGSVLHVEQHGPVLPEWERVVAAAGGDVSVEDRGEEDGEMDESDGQSVLTMWCRNVQCPLRTGRALQHFARALKAGIGENTVELMVEAGIVSSPPDFFRLAAHREAIEALPRMGEQRVNRILGLLDDAKVRMTPADTIAALGIPGISNALAARLAVQVGTLAGLAEADMADIELDGAGEASVAKGKLVAWMDANRAMVRDLAACGLGARDPVAPAGSLRSGLSANATATARASIVEGGNARSGPWAGKRVRITGAIEGHTRATAAAVAEALGARVVSSGARPDVVVAGAKPGSAATKWPEASVVLAADFLALASEHLKPTPPPEEHAGDE